MPQALTVEVEPLANGSAEAITVTVLVPVGVMYFILSLHADSPLAAIANRAIPANVVIVAQAPRIILRRIQNRRNPVKPPTHQSIELCAGEFGGLSTTTFNCVVATGYGVVDVLANTLTWPGEKTQMALAGSEDAKH